MSTELESRYARIGLVVDSSFDSSFDSPRDLLDHYNDAREDAIPIDFARSRMRSSSNHQRLIE